MRGAITPLNSGVIGTWSWSLFPQRSFGSSRSRARWGWCYSCKGWILKILKSIIFPVPCASSEADGSNFHEGLVEGTLRSKHHDGFVNVPVLISVRHFLDSKISTGHLFRCLKNPLFRKAFCTGVCFKLACPQQPLIDLKLIGRSTITSRPFSTIDIHCCFMSFFLCVSCVSPSLHRLKSWTPGMCRVSFGQTTYCASGATTGAILRVRRTSLNVAKNSRFIKFIICFFCGRCFFGWSVTFRAWFCLPRPGGCEQLRVQAPLSYWRAGSAEWRPVHELHIQNGSSFLERSLYN